MERKRIAILTNYPADLASFTGGVETVTAYLLEGFRECGSDFEFHVVSLSKTIKKNLHLSSDGIAFHFLAVPKNPLLKPHLPYNIMKCIRLLKELRPDLVHCQDNVALGLAAAVSGKPRLLTIHGVRRVEAKLWKGRTYWSHQADRLLEWLVHRHYHYFIGASPYVATLLNSGKQLFIVPNPISRLFFEGGSAPSRRNSREILFIGSLIHLKQVHVLIEAYGILSKEFKDLRMTICGTTDDDRYYQKLEKIVQANDLTGIRFSHDLATKDILELMKTAAMLVLPSLQENSPMTIAEAMAVGLPVVASRVGGIPYMIGHGKTGMLFRAGNVDELAACMRAMLENKDLEVKIRTTAREKALDNYQCQHIAQRTLAIYRSMIGRVA